MLDFPSSPTSGQYYTSSVRSWRYNGTTWVLLDDPWLDADSFSGQDPSYYRNAANLTGLFTGIVGYRYYNTSSSSNTGLGVVLYPQGGSYSTNAQLITGAIEITTPLSGENTMLYADVDIYNYSTSKAQKISIGGYLYSSPAWLSVSATTISNGDQNPTVRFGYSGDKYKIWIGELTGIWYYPKVLVHNIKLGFASNSPHQWSTGWSVSVQTGSFGTIAQTITNTQIGKYHNGSIIWNAGNDGTGSTLDADLLDGQHGSYYLDLTNLTGTTTSSKISDFTEAAQDAIGTSFFTFAGTVTGSYNDGSNTFLLSGIASTGGGVTSHTALTDLTADDHLQYLTSGRADTWLLQNSSFTGFTGSFTSNVESLISNTQLEDLLDVIYTNSPDEVQYNTLVYNVGGYWEPSKTISTHIAETGYHYTQASISITTGQVVGFIEAVQDIIGTGTFLKGSNGISGIYNDTSNILTLSGIDATYVQRGVASFDSAYFSVTTGKVSLASVPLAVIEQNTGPYVIGLSAVGVDSSPSAMSTSTVANLLTGSLTTPSFVTGIVTGLATGYLKVANNLSDVPDLSLTRQNLRVRYNLDDLSPFDSQGIWTSVSAGSGNTYQYDPQYGAACTREPGADGMVICSSNLGTGVGDASVRYHASPGLWLSTGSEFYFRAHHTSVLAAGNIFRFGLANAIANATGQIADGIYFELNGSTGAAIMCCTASGSTYSRTVSSYSPTVSKWTWYIIKFLGTGVAFYTDGNNTPIATIYNNYPGATARASRVFWQCAGTGLPNYKGIMVDKIAYPYIVSSLPSGLYL